MPLIELQTKINADLKTCFDLARCIDLHKESLKHTGQIAIAGKITGLIGLGEWVTWEAKHFGFVRHLTSKVTALDCPNYFSDKMVFGVFKSYKHERFFREENKKTIMIDKVYFESPYGVVGKLANWLFLKNYMIKLLVLRNTLLKERSEIAYLKSYISERKKLG